MHFGKSFNFSDENINGTQFSGRFDLAAWLQSSNISLSDLSVVPQISTEEKTFKILAYVLAIILSLILNSLIIIVIVRTQSLRTKFNFYVLNMAFVNILIALTCMWLHLVTNLNPSNWPLGHFFCKINIFLQVLVVSVSTFTLTLTVSDRFFAASYPRLLVITQGHQITVIILTWILGAVLALPWLLFSRFVEFDWLGGHEILCQAHFPSDDFRKAYITASVVIGYAVPVAIMFLLIILTMVRSAPPKEPTTDQKKAFDQMKRKAITMLLTVLVVFFVCWSPPQAINLWDVYRYKGPGAKLPSGIHALTYASFYIAYFSSCVYPMVYVSFNKCFRHAAWAFITRKPVNITAVSTLPDEPGPSRSEDGSSCLELQRVSGDNFTAVSLST